MFKTKAIMPYSFAFGTCRVDCGVVATVAVFAAVACAVVVVQQEEPPVARGTIG